jgi:hypothetical protein
MGASWRAVGSDRCAAAVLSTLLALQGASRFLNVTTPFVATLTRILIQKENRSAVRH